MFNSKLPLCIRCATVVLLLAYRCIVVHCISTVVASGSGCFRNRCCRCNSERYSVLTADFYKCLFHLFYLLLRNRC
jgi:hypothetical protein